MTGMSPVARTSLPSRMLAWVLALPMIAPLLFLAASWREPQIEVWAHLREFVLADVMRDTALLAAAVFVLVSVIGIGLAWLSARCDYPGRRWLDWALVLPLAMPGYVAAFAYVGLFDYAGPVQSAWRALSGSRAALADVRSLGGAALVLSLVLYPYVYLVVRAAFLKQGAAAFDAARNLGLGPWRAFLRVALPLARPAWIAGASLALLETLADFGAVSILGVDTFTTAIYKTWFGLYSLPGAAQLACVLLLVVSAVLLAERALRGPGRISERSLRPMPRIVLRGARAWGASVFAAGVFVLGFVLPVARLLHWAVESGALLPGLGEVAFNTASIGAVVAGVVLVIGLVFALLEHRHASDRWLRTPVFVANLGYAVPGTVLAVASMLLLLGAERALADRFGWSVALSSSLAAMVLALSMRFLRVGHETLDSGLAALRPELIESARVLGVGSWQRLRRIILPVLRPSLLTALLLVLVETMKEMPATLMLRPFGWDTLAVKIHGYTAEGLWQEAAWPALLLIVIGLLPIWLLVRRSRDS
jgi:iron(III) transport system permease protein